MNECQGDIVPVNEVSLNRDWIFWIKDLQYPKNSRLKCYLCSMTRKYNKLRYNQYAEMAKDEGILYPTKAENLKAIKNHAASRGHARVKEDFKKLDLGNVVESLADLIATKGTNPFYEATNNVMKSVFYEVGIHNSLNSHPQTMEFLQGFGINVGKPHCHTSDAARNFVVAMGETYHYNFIGSLTDDKPMTLSKIIIITMLDSKLNTNGHIISVVDSSTDKSNKNQFATMLYTFEHGLPMLYHYRLIELDAISTGAAKFEKFEKALYEDGILDYVKRNLVVRLSLKINIIFINLTFLSLISKAIVSDAGSDLMGKHNGFAALLQKNWNTKVVVHHCLVSY